MTTRSYQVPDISCGHCKTAIEGEVGALTQVDQVTVDIDARTVTVMGDVDDSAVHAAIEEAGYAVAPTSCPGAAPNRTQMPPPPAEPTGAPSTPPPRSRSWSNSTGNSARSIRTPARSSLCGAPRVTPCR